MNWNSFLPRGNNQPGTQSAAKSEIGDLNDEMQLLALEGQAILVIEEMLRRGDLA